MTHENIFDILRKTQTLKNWGHSWDWSGTTVSTLQDSQGWHSLWISQLPRFSVKPEYRCELLQCGGLCSPKSSVERRW